MISLIPHALGEKKGYFFLVKSRKEVAVEMGKNVGLRNIEEFQSISEERGNY